ncbi:hypothetical protein J8273_5603 [Carpediemonas membranifera]|uniref:Uncharacterized protein n=1 Tax=Carpediemonas membranifera TaxID=201153 RepID=A0A8J6E147_9EUKA|nr:hypothetical protein J8273_5603 [Carpediemonas membranifera]|eukprot:KAG9393008.1 hypothetical protein J8273_5603 [Carpediemonas membranifera]
MDEGSYCGYTEGEFRGKTIGLDPDLTIERLFNFRDLETKNEALVHQNSTLRSEVEELRAKLTSQVRIAAQEVEYLQDERAKLQTLLSAPCVHCAIQTDPEPEPPIDFSALPSDQLVPASELAAALTARDTAQAKATRILGLYNDQTDMVAELDNVAKARLDEIVELRRQLAASNAPVTVASGPGEMYE